MAKAKARKPLAQVPEGAGGAIRPVDQYSEELIQTHRPGQVYDLVPRVPKRSEVQLRWYWGLLQTIVEATEITPTAEHLHDMLMKEAGFVVRIVNPFTGRWAVARDSIAMDKMPPEQMNLYVNTAIRLIAEAFGMEQDDVIAIYPPKNWRRA